MQLHMFSTGGCVAHRVTLAGYALRFSVWIAADGSLTDAEGFDARNRSRGVTVGSPAWKALASYAPHVLRVATAKNGARV